MKSQMLLRLFATLTVAFGPILSAHASTYAYEGFDYPLGNLMLGSGTGRGTAGDNWAGSWGNGFVIGGFPIVAGSLSIPAAVIPSTGGHIEHTTGGGYSAQRYLTPRPITVGEDLWFSAEMTSSAQPGTRTEVQFHFTSGLGGSSMFFETTARPGPAEPLRWTLQASGLDYGPEVVANVPAMLVAKLHRNAPPSPAGFTITFWVNAGPNTGLDGNPTDPPVTTPRFVAGTEYSTLYGVLLNIGNALPGLPYQFDEIRIGTTYADINRYPPVIITCPEPVTAECGAVPAAATDTTSFGLLGGRVNGGCGPLTVTHVDVPAGTCPTIITRTYRANDTCGQTNVCTQTITVRDTIAPEISPAPGPVNVQCTSDIPVLGTLSASDNCGALTATATDGPPVGSYPCKYSFTRTWNVSDACGNPAPAVTQLISVQDTQPPLVNMVPGSLDRTVEAGDAVAVAAALALTAPTFTDVCQGPVTPVLTTAFVEVPPMTSCVGYVFERRWHATDACGNSTNFVQRISFTDTHGPTLTCPTIPPVTTGPGPVFFAATASDNSDLFPPATSVTLEYDHPSGSTFRIGTTPVICTARDKCGNTTVCTFNVTVTARGCTSASQQAYVKASNTGELDYFGNSVAIDGDTMVVGAPFEGSDTTGVNGPDNNNAVSSGAAYIFVRNGTTWSQQAYLKASNTGTGDYFGRSVAISGDTVVIGAEEEDSNATGVNGPDNNNAVDSGAAYIFVRNGTTWSQQAYLKASNTGARDYFGASVAISGNTVVVGASAEDSNAIGVNGTGSDPSQDSDSGAAYVFVRSGTIWSQQAYLKASNRGGSNIGVGDYGDFFGVSVAISGDTVVVGAPGEDSDATGVDGDQSNNKAPSSGAAYVFVRNDTTWSQQAYLKASNTGEGTFAGGSGDGFGYSVAVSSNTVVVGAVYEDSNATGINGPDNNLALDSGAAYIFVRNTTTWSQQAYLKASNTQGASGGGLFPSGDHFGWAVAVSGDIVVVGASGEDSNASGVNGYQGNNSAISSGAAYVFVRNATSWSQQAYLKASNPDIGQVARGTTPELGDWLGGSVAVSGDTVVCGAPGEESNFRGVQNTSLATLEQSDNNAYYSGAAYVFELANVPCVRDASFPVPGDSVVVIPVSGLLANGAQPQGLPLTLSSHDLTTAHGFVITPVGSPVMALEFPPVVLPAGVTEDTFTYRLSDGAHEATGTVHLLPVAVPPTPLNSLRALPPPILQPSSPGGLTLVFGVPAAGTFALERKTFAAGSPGSVEGAWTEVARTQSQPGPPPMITFVDGFLPGGAIYRVRTFPVGP